MEEENKINEVDENEASASLDNTTEEEQVSEEPIEEKKADSIDGDYNGSSQPTSTIDNAYFNEIKYINDGTRTIDEDIECVRKTYMKKLSTSRTCDIVCLVVMVLAFVAVVLVTFLNTNSELAWVTYVVLGVALAIIVGSFVVSSIFNKKRTKVTGDYLKDFEDTTNGYVLSDLSLRDPRLCVEGKLDDQIVIQAHYFRTINAIQSRAIVQARRKERDFICGEVAVIIPPVSYIQANTKPNDYLTLEGVPYVPSETNPTLTGTQEIPTKDMTLIDLDLSSEASGNSKELDKRNKDSEKAKKRAGNAPTETQTGLYGKIISYDMKVTSEEAFIITFMGNKETTVLPDYTSGFSAIKVPGLRNNIVVYAANINASASFFSEENVRLLNKIVPDMAVQSLFISVNSYGSKIGLTLSDDIMSLPFKQIKHIGSFDSFKTALDDAFAFLDRVDELRIKE